MGIVAGFSVAELISADSAPAPWSLWSHNGSDSKVPATP